MLVCSSPYDDETVHNKIDLNIIECQISVSLHVTQCEYNIPWRMSEKTMFGTFWLKHTGTRSIRVL